MRCEKYLCTRYISQPTGTILSHSNISWKIAHVIAIFKKGDKSLPSNYRPISLISCVGKIMERVIYKYVVNHLQRNKLIYEYQSGFLPKYSTSNEYHHTALLIKKGRGQILRRP
jgi:hypothetical protein